MKERKLGILGRKVGMTRVFDNDGNSLGVTVLEVGPCVVLQKRTDEVRENGKTDGYNALQIGFDQKPAKKLLKSEKGHLKAAGGEEKARRFVREVRVSKETAGKFEVGQDVTIADLELNSGDLVDVTGRSQGKGFQGVFRKFNFRGQSRTHGVHEMFRHGGSIGCRKWPGRVFKGRKMPGHMGDRRVTTQNLEIVEVRPEENLVLVNGSVPGANNGYVLLRAAIKKNPLP